MTAEETLYTYHPIKHDLELRTDLWPTSTIVDAMEEYAAHAAEKARQEERERHKSLVQFARDAAEKMSLSSAHVVRTWGEYADEALKAAGYEIKEEK